jgi:hypothetical protein
MRAIWKRTTALTLSASLAGGCATSPDKIQSAYVSPLQYQNYSCKDIREELGRVTTRAQALQTSLQEKSDNDTGKMVIGMVFFWPILFALDGDDPSSQEYARLKGERDALEQLATQKKCGNLMIVDVKPEETGKQVAMQPAASTPMQPAQQASSQQVAAPAAPSTEERLSELKALKDKGLIADEVYREEQHRILAEATPAAQPAPTAVAMAAPAAPAAPARVSEGPSGLRAGDHWDYTVVDSRKGVPAQRSFEIEQASASGIVERIRFEDGKTLTAEHGKGPYLSMQGGMQFAPYYVALQPVVVEGPVGELKVLGGSACESVTAGYRRSIECHASGRIEGAEQITVPAGTFDTVRVRVDVQLDVVGGSDHTSPVAGTLAVGQYWISPQAGRIVKASVEYRTEQPWSETMELAAMQVARAQPPRSASTSVAAAAPAAAHASVAATPPSSPATPAPAAEPTAESGPGGLRQGNRWDYVVVDSRKGLRAERSFEIEQANQASIVERIKLEDGKTVSAEHGKGPYLSMLGGMQFAPYYLALQPVVVEGPVGAVSVKGGDACATREELGGDYASAHECQIDAKIAGSDRITVPAGTFDAVRVHVTIHSQQVMGLHARQHIGDGDFWISPQAGRLVKATMNYDASRPWTESMELVSTNVAFGR